MNEWSVRSAGADEWSPRAVLEWVRWIGWRRVLGGVVVIALAAFVGWWLLRPAPPAPDAVLPTLPVDAATAPSSSAPTSSLVHVTGAVVSPGVVEVDASARVRDAIDAAGGALGRADLESINLAARVDDGAQIHVPAIGEITTPRLVSPVGDPSAPSLPIDLNVADETALDSLPGIGPATAAAIVERRNQVGRFVTVDDLLDVPGIGPAKVEVLRDLVRV